MLEPKICLACGSPVNPLPPVNANSFEETYPPKSWQVNCPNCGTATVIQRSDLPEELIQELQDSRNGWESSEAHGSAPRQNNVDPTDDQYESDLSPLDLDDLFGTEPSTPASSQHSEPSHDELSQLDSASGGFARENDDSDEIVFADESEYIVHPDSDQAEHNIDDTNLSRETPAEQPVDPSIIDDLFVDDHDSADPHFQSEPQPSTAPEDDEEPEVESFQASWRADDDSAEEGNWNPDSKEFHVEDDAWNSQSDVQESHDWEQSDDSQASSDELVEAADSEGSQNIDAIPTTPLPGEWNKEANDQLLKRKKEPSLLRKVLPPLLGAGAAIPIALGILWYGFGRDLGGIGATIAQYVPAVVPQHLHGRTQRPASYQPQIPSTTASNNVEATDITDLGRPEQSDANVAAALPTEDLSDDLADATAPNSPEPAIGTIPKSSTDYVTQVQQRVRSVVAAQTEFLTVGANNGAQRIPLANKFWLEVQSLGGEVNAIAESELAHDPSGHEIIQQTLGRDIAVWGRQAIDDSKVPKFLERFAKGFSGLTDQGPPQILIENLHYPDEIDVDYAIESAVTYAGKPIEIHVPGAILKSLGKPNSDPSKTLLIGRTVETANGYQFMVSFGMR